MSEEDHLSYNPMLLSILSHLECRDIFRCKMVNRRILEVIEANKRDLDTRLLGCLTMKTMNTRIHQGKTKVALVVLSFYSALDDKRFDLLFTKSGVVVTKNNMLPVTQYFEKKYKRIQYKYWWSKADDQVWRYLTQKSTGYELDRHRKYRARVDLFHYPEYRTKGIVDTLSAFLSFIGSAFEFDLFKINPADFDEFINRPQIAHFPDQQMTSIMDTLLNVTSSRCLTISSRYPNLVNFYKEFGCKWFNLKPNANISSFLHTLHLDDMFVGILINKEEFFDSLVPIHNILQEWKSGRFSLRAISFNVPMSVTIKFTNEEVLEAFRDLEYFSVKEEPQISRSEPGISFFIRRPTDNKIIGLKYGQNDGLTIRECLNRDDEEPHLNEWHGWDFDKIYYWCPRSRSYQPWFVKK